MTTLEGPPVGPVLRRRSIHQVVACHHLNEAGGYRLAAAAERALRLRLPVLLTTREASEAGERGNAFDTLGDWGAAARVLARCSGTVPILAVVDRPVASIQALLLGLADVVVMTEDGVAHVSSPTTAAALTGLPRSAAAWGGPQVHAEVSGLAAIVVDDVEEARLWLDMLLSYLAPDVDSEPPPVPTLDQPGRHATELRDVVPADPKEGYDARDVILPIVDDAQFLELRERWAPSVVVGFASVAGRAVGVVANQPQVMAGTIDIAASQKAARFVALCDAFNVPLLTFVDTPGFLPGVDVEWRGMIRHGAQMAHAYAEATVPRVAIVTRKAYGGAYIVMDCKAMGNDVCFAWPSAEIAVMGARAAVQILDRRADEQTRPALEREYEETYANPYMAAARGYVDDVIDPAETRPRVGAALEMLQTKREHLTARRHGNGPL